jgi:hypothetical protein
MTHPRDYLPVLDNVEAALEASCGALIALQRVDADLADTIRPDGIHGHIERAEQRLREAIEELRQAQYSGASGLALGFVLEEGRRAANGRSTQSRPRRTA